MVTTPKSPPAKPSGDKSTKSKPKTAAKKAGRSVDSDPGSYILPAAPGYRTVSHKRIKAAVEAVFRDRLARDG